MRIAVCDDNIDILKQVSEQTEAVPFVDKVTSYNNFDDMVADINSGIGFDAVLMDIEWGDEASGINFGTQLNEIAPNTKVIFVTGYQEQYSQKIFLCNTNLGGFLVKPVDQELLEKMLGKLREEQIQADARKLAVSFGSSVTSVDTADIYYLESSGHTVTIYSKDGVHLCYERLEALRTRLPEQFEYSHKSFLVNMDHIKRIERFKLILLNGMEMPISKGRYTEFKKVYFNYIGSSL